MLIGARAEGLAFADPGGRTPIGVCENLYVKHFGLLNKEYMVKKISILYFSFKNSVEVQILMLQVA